MFKKKCQHDYEIIDKHEMRSPLDKMLDRGLSQANRMNNAMMRSKLVIIYKCKKCKKLKESVFVNPE